MAVSFFIKWSIFRLLKCYKPGKSQPLCGYHTPAGHKRQSHSNSTILHVNSLILTTCSVSINLACSKLSDTRDETWVEGSRKCKLVMWEKEGVAGKKEWEWERLHRPSSPQFPLVLFSCLCFLDSVGAWNGLPLTQKKNGQMSFLGTYEINYKMAASDGKCLISTILRAAVCKYRLGCAKWANRKFPNFVRI